MAKNEFVATPSLIEVVGFEGGKPGCPIAYGTAAVKMDGHVLNTISRRFTSLSEWDYCVEEGYATAVGPLVIPDDRKAILETKCMLLRLELPAEAAPKAVECWRNGAAYTWDTPAGTFMLFSTFNALIEASRGAMPHLKASEDLAALHAFDVLESAMFYHRSV